MVEHQAELTQLQNSYQAVQRNNADLRQKVQECNNELSQKDEEQDQLMEENETLHKRNELMQSELLAMIRRYGEVQDNQVGRWRDSRRSNMRTPPKGLNHLISIMLKQSQILLTRVNPTNYVLLLVPLK